MPVEGIRFSLRANTEINTDGVNKSDFSPMISEGENVGKTTVVLGDQTITTYFQHTKFIAEV